MQALILCVALCGADPAPELPQGAPPEVATIKLSDDGKNVVVRRRQPTMVTEQMTRMVKKQITKTVEENGRQVQKTETIDVPEPFNVAVCKWPLMEQTIPREGLKFQTASGSPSDRQLGTEPMTALIAPPSAKIDRTALALFPADTPIATVSGRGIQKAVEEPAHKISQPQLALGKVSDGRLVVRVNQPSTVYKEVPEQQRGPDGRTITVMKKVGELVMSPAEYSFAMASPNQAHVGSAATIKTASGEPVKNDSLSKATPVLLLTNYADADPVLLKLLKPEVVVVQVGQLPTGGAPPGAIPVTPAVPIPATESPVPTAPLPTPATPSPKPSTTPPVPMRGMDTPQQDDPATAERHRLDGRQFLAHRRYAEAICAFERAMIAAPGDPGNAFFLAFAQREAGKFDDADQTMQRAAGLECGLPIEPLGLEWERFQGPSRAWLANARTKAHSHIRPPPPPPAKPTPAGEPAKSDF